MFLALWRSRYIQGKPLPERISPRRLQLHAQVQGTKSRTRASALKEDGSSRLAMPHSTTQRVQVQTGSGTWFQKPYPQWYSGLETLNIGNLDPLGKGSLHECRPLRPFRCPASSGNSCTAAREEGCLKLSRSSTMSFRHRPCIVITTRIWLREPSTSLLRGIEEIWTCFQGCCSGTEIYRYHNAETMLYSVSILW